MKRALLIIDVQYALFDIPPEPDQATEVINHLNQLSEKARQQHAPVIFVQHEDDDFIAYQSQNWQLDKRLIQRDGDYYIRKTTPDSFYKTNLNELLTKLGVTDLVIAGYASEYCVDTTVRKAASLKYNVILASDAHTTHDKPHLTAQQIRKHHTMTLSTMMSFDATIEAKLTKDITFE
ncbi:cysteine hydrolase family protein [Zophobihabitans entericus]|uniref:Cysteine hydrolase n=1 Tax=Zophobihabitans entericus TaxID=1635327 RepID=A0A6G9ICT4_9GAMM|nr:cysteine hydrolase family protein [Zophobihabitans entericus]QIQ21514.1 cysteine hydrolase [Zophobihabitans entericus]